MAERNEPQGDLFDVGAAVPVRCRRCGGRATVTTRGVRCRPCDKDLPSPGGDAWRKWTRGIGRTVRERLWDVGLQAHETLAMRVVLFDADAADLPVEVRAQVADLLALACSPGRYERGIERLVREERLADRFRREGYAPADAERAAKEASDWIEAEKVAAAAEGRPPAWKAPTGLRVEVPGLRIAVELEWHVEDAAEAEALAIGEAAEKGARRA